MLNTPFSPWPSFTPEEADAVREVVLLGRVNYWTGSQCREFEREFAAWSGARYAIALMNGTVALDVALKALGVGPGDEVVVTPRSFIASVSCVVNAGATPVFADVDADTGNLTAVSIDAVCSPRTKAVIAVHLAGWPCDLDPIMALAERRGFFVIEDCAQAHGAVYKGRSVGSIGHVGCWSFCQDKIMTTGGEGGMVTCNDESLWRAMWAFKDHGKSYAAVYEREHPPGFRWLHEGFGTNWRMTEMQAAIGRIQLGRMKDWTAKRSANAAVIREALLPFAGEGGVVRVPEMRCGDCRLRRWTATSATPPRSDVDAISGVIASDEANQYADGSPRASGPRDDVDATFGVIASDEANQCENGSPRASGPRDNVDATFGGIASDEVARRSTDDACTCQHANYKFYAYVQPENLADGWSRDRIVDEIISRGVPCYTGSCSEIYLEKAFDGSGFRPAERLTVARALGETSLMFLVHPTLTAAEIRKTQDVVAEVLALASSS